MPFIITLVLFSCAAVLVRSFFDFYNLYSVVDYATLHIISLIICIALVMRAMDLRVRLLKLNNRKNIPIIKFVLSLAIAIFVLGFQKWHVARSIDENNFPVVNIHQFKDWDKVKYVKIRNLMPLNENVMSIKSTLEWVRKFYKSGAYTQFLVTHLAPIDLQKNIWVTETFEQNLRTSEVDLESDLASYTELTHRVFTSREYKIFSYFEILKPSEKLKILRENVSGKSTPVFVQPVYFSHEAEFKKTIYYLLYIAIPVIIAVIVLLFFRIDISQLENFHQKKMTRRWF